MAGILLGIAVLGPIAALAGAEAGAAASAGAAAGQARQDVAAGNFAQAVAIYDALASRPTWLHLFDASDISGAALGKQNALLGWAKQLTAQKKPEAALTALDGVTDPSLQTAMQSQKGATLLAAAQEDNAAAHFVGALQWLQQLQSLKPPAPQLQQALNLLPEVQLGVAGEEMTQGNPVDAVALLDAVRKGTSTDAAVQAEAQLPAALLAAGQLDIAQNYFPEALTMLQRLTAEFPDTSQAATASGILRRPLPVTGTLAHKNGGGLATKVRLGSNYHSMGAEGYQTSAPFYYSNADQYGDFSFSSIPVGGPYVLEFESGGSWTTLIDPGTGQPSVMVTLTPLNSADLGFILLPS